MRPQLIKKSYNSSYVATLKNKINFQTWLIQNDSSGKREPYFPTFSPRRP